MPAATKAPRFRPRLRRLFKWLVLPLVLSVVLLATPPGLWLCAKVASVTVSALTPYSLHLSGVSGALPISFRAQRIVLLDQAGPWLGIEGLSLRVSLRDFVRGRSRLLCLTAAKIQWERLPIREKRWRIPQIPGFDHFPAVDSICIPDLSLGAPILGRPMTISINGRVEIIGSGNGQRIVLTARRTDGRIGEADISYEQDGDAPKLRAVLNDADILPYWLGLDSPLALDIEGSGPRTDWRGTLHGSSASQTILDGELRFSGEFPTVITASLDTNIATSRRLQALERLLGPDTHFSFDALLAKSGVLDVLELSASSPRGVLQGAGAVLLNKKTFHLGFEGAHADLALLSCKEEGEGFYLPTTVSATVTGDVSRIDLRLFAASRNLPLFNSETTILPGQPVRVEGEATVFTAPFTATTPAAVLFGDSAAFAWSAAYAAPGQLTFQSLALDNQALQLDASGSVTFPLATADIGYAGMLHAERFPVLAAYLSSMRDIPFTGTLTDTLTAPTLSLAASGIDASVRGVVVNGGALNIGFHLEPSGYTKSLRNGSIRIDAPQCGYGELTGLASSCTANFESDHLGLFRLSNLAVSVPAIAARLTADGTFARGTGMAAFGGKLLLDNLAAPSTFFEQSLGGALTAAFHAERKGSAAPLQFSAECDWNHPSGLPELLQAAAGERLGASLRLESDPHRVTLHEGRLDCEAGTLSVHGWQDNNDRTFKLFLESKEVDLAKAVRAKSFQSVRGTVALSSVFQGTPNDFTVKGDARINHLAWDRISISSTKLGWTANHFPGAPEGTATLSATNGKKGLSLEGSLAFLLSNGALRIDKAKLRSGKNRIAGGFAYGFDTAQFSANADFDFPALGDLSSLLGVDLSGTAQGKVAASMKGKDLDLTVVGKAAQLKTPWGSVAALDANGSVTNVLHEPKGSAKIVAAQLSRNGLMLDHADISMSGEGASANAKAELSGTYKRNGESTALPFTLTTSARASAQGGELTVTDAAGKLADVDFTLNGPAHIHRSGADYTLDPVAITAGKGRAEMAIRGTASEIHSTGNWKDFPLSLALLAGFDGIEGTSSGSLSLDGPLQSPACRLDVRLTQLRNTALDHGPGVDISIKADHDGQWTTAEANATLSDAAKTLLSARLPVNLSLSPPRFALREQDNLQADAELTADLPASAALMDWTNDLPRGIITGKFRLAGTMAVPRVSGELNLEDGGYENLRYGAIIKNLRIRLVADGSTVRIEEFTGTDGESGKLSATGQMEVSFARKHPFRADVTLDRMRSLRTEYGTALLSGKLQFAGDMGDSTLKGAVTIQEGDFRLPDRFSSAKAPEVEYTDKDAPQQPAAAPSNSAPVMPTMALDLAVSVPGRVYLRAPVLETEWNGDLHLRGTLNEPRTEGTLRVIRGYLDLIGQRFALTDSNVGFINGNMRAPYLNMTGVCMANDITARIQLSGPPSDAQLTLSSDPPMPQDEILSKLLFRKGVSQASPLQAIQVARTAAMFSDRLSLPQFLTGSVKLPGVDLFDIRTGEKVDKTVVGVGKYINDKIYVEAEQGASTDSGRVSAQVEVTPRVSVKADVGARNRGGVGIFWKKDY